MNWWQHFFYSIDANAWIQTLSGFLGALLAGAIAIFLYLGQNKVTYKRERIKEIESFLKVNNHLEYYLKDCIRMIETIKSIEDSDLSVEAKIEGYQRIMPLLNEKIELIDNLDLDKIVYELHGLTLQTVISLRTCRDVLKLNTNPQTIEYLELKIGDYYDVIEQALDQIETVSIELKKALPEREKAI